MISICEQATGVDNRLFWRELNSRISSRRIPFSGSLALTHRCNLGCVHCYAKESPDGSSRQAELSTAHWLRIMNEIREAGCLNVLLTGGEPLLRKDFPEIYVHAKKSGFLVTVFTNATMVDAAILGLFEELPPRLVEVSIYGAKPVIHDRITGGKGSFAMAMRGIESLLDRGIQVRLKSVLMTLNSGDFAAMEDLARGLGVEFRFDPAIFPTLNGDREPVKLRVAPELAVELELAHPEKIEEWRDFLGQFRGAPSAEGLFICGAGVNAFHVDPEGWLYPCIMMKRVRRSLLAESFSSAWEQDFSGFRKESLGPDMPCRVCDKKLACGYCPGFFDMENGSQFIPSAYLCEIGRLRFARVNLESLRG